MLLRVGLGGPGVPQPMVEIRHKETGKLLRRVRARTLACVDLHGADLQQARLNGADLEGANLQATDLRGISLRGANLTGVQLQAAMCTDADMSGAVLCAATMRGTKIVGACLAGADLSDADLEGAVLITASFAGARLERANLRGSNLTWAKFHGASLTEVNLEGANLANASFSGMELHAVNLEGATLGEAAVGYYEVPIPRLAGATFDSETRWPAGFDPREWGALRSDEPLLIPQTRYPPMDPEWLARQNAETWHGIVAFYEDLVKREGWHGLTPMLRLVRGIAASDRSRYYRAGTSLYTLILSTKVEHGLGPGDSWLAVQPSLDGTFQVTYVKGTPHNEEQYECGESDLMPTLIPLLDRLWADTRG